MRMKNLIFFDSKAKLTYILIFLCIAVFVWENIYTYQYGADAAAKLMSDYGLSLENILDGRWYSIFTSMFLHAGSEHLILNLLALFFFGRVVEEEFGWKKTLLIFILSGIVGNIFYLGASFFGMMPASIPVIGASGAIFGVMGTAMLTKPFHMIFYPYLIPVPLVIVAVLYALYNITDFILVLALAKESSIAYISHIGGLITGMVFGFKQEGRKKGMLILLLIIALMVLLPMFWYLFSFLEQTNYLSLMSQVFS